MELDARIKLLTSLAVGSLDSLTLQSRLREIRKNDAATERVAAWIGAAYWFTASTSFANPAITIARAFSNTFSGIAPVNVLAFIASQVCGALLGLILAKWLQIDRVAHQ